MIIITYLKSCDLKKTTTDLALNNPTGVDMLYNQPTNHD